MSAPLSTDAKMFDRESARRPGRFAQVLGRYTIQWLLLIALLIMGIASPTFRSPANLANVLRQASFAGIAAAGMTVLMITGAFDLSVAGIVGLCGVVLAKLLGDLGIAPAVLITLLLGLLLGAINGLVVTKVRVPAFIATLGMMYIFLAAALILTNGQVVPVANRTFRSLGSGNVFAVPTPFLIMLLVYGIAALLLRLTKYGRYMRAVGSNQIAARTAGLPVHRVQIVAFMAVGLCTALTATLLTGMLSSANAVMATGFELTVISVVVVGGTSLKGGSGTLLGSFTGAIFFAVINNALNMFRVEAYWQYIAIGLILIIALAIDAFRRRYMAAGAT